MTGASHIFIGISGNVLALDRATGEEVWKTALKGGDFVNVVLDGGAVIAATKGEIFCLDPATGSIRWHNTLKGLGWGLVSIAQAGGANLIAMEEQRRREQAAAQNSST